MGKQWQTLFSWAWKSLQMVTEAMKLKDVAPWKTSYDKPTQCIKKQRHYFTNKGPSSQSYGFSSSYVWMWELEYKESWVPNNWCFWTVVLEKTLQSPLDSKEIQPVNTKGNQSWLFTGSIDAEAETPILWPHDAKNWVTGKNPDARKDWRWEKGITEDEMLGWHHQCDGHEFKFRELVMDREAWRAAVHELAKSQKWLSNWTEYVIHTNMCVYFPGLPMRTSLGAQKVMNLPAMQKSQIWSLGWKDALEEGMATHSSILA